jgi:hypothetical protein
MKILIGLFIVFLDRDTPKNSSVFSEPANLVAVNRVASSLDRRLESHAAG